MPTLKMARAIHWLPLLAILENCPVVRDINRSDYRISFHGARPDLILRGSDNQGDRLRGLNLIWAGLDEFQDVNPNVWGEILFPALARNRDWESLIIGTPKGRASYFFRIHEQALREPDWSYFHFHTSHNPFFPKTHLERARRELPPKVYRQEFEASWEDFDGQILSSISPNHIAQEVPDSFRSVFLGLDWGDVNPCLVVIGLTHQGAYYLLDHWQNRTGQPVTEVELEKRAGEFCKEYGIYRAYLPDDRPASVLSFRRYGKAQGIPGLQRSIQVQRSKPGVMERATILDSLFYQNRLYFTARTRHLYDIFASYHRAKDKDGNLLNKPADAQDDHAVDATAYPIGTIEFKHGDNVLAHAA
ncbi:hypothetical protein IQ273_12810 [Nodosilinea sp. LEGE 07298]|uniref:hypothetical protein n=1 Tax=Nodosilinea sp. LEGE 07298 TaxID=2777970 RepID=UPI001880C515|nr:hypothetical protein [Nodosilinea sp. LEGE 07298]MBE9110293.1 hypothetical protein [Nodosilinea sp. LEGE 07298]